jgi:GNAT superfamily N-acetyltransferase
MEVQMTDNITLEKLDLKIVNEQNFEKNKIFTEMWNDAWVELIALGSLARETPPINKMKGIFYFIKVDDIPVGIRVYYPITPEFYESLFTYVKPDYRKRGLRVITREMAYKELKEQGVKRITDSVMLTVQSTIDMYKKLGIEPVAYRYEFDI